METKEFRLKIYPKDFDKVRSFFADELGLPIAHEWDRAPDDRGTMFNVGGTTLELLSPEEEYKPAGIGLSLEVPDVNKLWEDYKSKNYITHELRHNSWGDTSFQIVDPEGIKISLFTKD